VALLAWCISCLVIASSACEREAVDSSPELVVDAFIERMKGVHGDPERGRLAYELLWAEGREALAERARRATAAAGRPIGPEEMLVPSRFSLAFEPRRVTAETKGKWSRVTVIGSNPNEVAEVSCVNEDGHWRVAVEFPPLPTIEQRL
jgi:hypothetical protein